MEEKKAQQNTEPLLQSDPERGICFQAQCIGTGYRIRVTRVNARECAARYRGLPLLSSDSRAYPQSHGVPHKAPILSALNIKGQYRPSGEKSVFVVLTCSLLMAPVETNHSSEGVVPRAYSSTIPLGEYLFLRIAQANPQLKSIFGIPGDFNLRLLEHLYAPSVADEKNIEFIGICNELNAAYAADGYAKAIKGLSVLITTYGVGELSALNGIAGAFAEFAPVLHIVGTTSTKQSAQAKSAQPKDVRNIHHLVQSKNALAAPNHDVYKRAAEDFSVVQETLGVDADENVKKIDRVITTILKENRPGYLFISSDLPDTPVPRQALEAPISLNEMKNSELLEDIAATILNKLYCSERPSILGSPLVSRFRAQDNFTKFVESMPTNFVKLFSSAMARNVNESLPNYVGMYQGYLTVDKNIIRSLEEKTDFLLNLGHLNNEINSGGYSQKFDKIEDYVEVHPDYIYMDGTYTHIKNMETGERAFSLDDLMAKLAADFDKKKLVNNDGKVNNIDYKYEPPKFALNDTVDERVITQNKLTDFFNNYLQPDDILIAETCSFLFAIGDLLFPNGVEFYSQYFYGSIGYALPATLGVSRAVKDLGSKRRIILIQGDGSAQMTIQELSSYLRYDIEAPKIFLLNNEGYTVERIILGPTRSYNDIQDTWRWTNFFKIFGDAKEEKHTSKLVQTAPELKAINREKSDKIELYELCLPKLDVPERFKKMFH